jgi:hypothetical protein
MLVVMNTVTQCMVVSSTLSSVCLPIMPLQPLQCHCEAFLRKTVALRGASIAVVEWSNRP